MKKQPEEHGGASSSLPYMPRLDGLRAVAVAGVLIEHFCPIQALRSVSPGGAGVSLFFVLSGYLITRVLMKYRAQSLGRAAVHFYWRRILRLSPPFYIAIIVSLAFGLNQMRDNWWIHALYLSNFQIGVAGRWIGDADHFWSLCVEEQFYFLWFFVVVMTPVRLLPRTILCAFLITLLFRSGVYFLGLRPLTTVLLPGNLATLAMGALIAYVSTLGAPARLDHLFLDRRLLVTFGLSFALLSLSLPFAYALNIFLYPFLASAFFATVVRIAASPQPDRWFDWLSWRPLRHVGKISYGIFVYHMFIGGILERVFPDLWGMVGGSSWSGFFLLVVLSIAVAEVSWFLVERPLLSLKAAAFIPTPREIRASSSI